MSDPKRLAEEGPDALQRMLSVAQDDVLREDEQVEVERRLRAAGLLATSTAVVAGATRKATVAKLAVAGAALALVVGGVWALRRSPPPAPNGPAPAGVAASPTAKASVSVSASGSASESAPELEMLDPPSPAASAPKPKTLASASAKADPVTPESEGLLLLRAKRVLREDPAQALALVREHEKRFPDSQLGPERKRILADAQALLAKKNP